MMKLYEFVISRRHLNFMIMFIMICSSSGLLDINFVCSEAAGLNLKAVNLGGWLVTEGWIHPSLFDGIPNNDLLDGTEVQLKSPVTGKYLCAEHGGGSIIVANRTSASGWETLKLWRITETTFQFRVFFNQFMGLTGSNNSVLAIASTPTQTETFEIIRNPNDTNRIHIRASNGKYLQARTEDLVTADFIGEPSWGDDNPAVFTMTVNVKMRGEYQVTNGYSDQAARVMNDHWTSFIVEDDFEFIANNGLNAVRIPIGWWIANDPNPPKPFVGGSLAFLDKALLWSSKYGLKVIIDLHCAPGSQNGYEHSGTRDGVQEWGLTQASIDQTVAVIDFLAERYSFRPNLAAIQLINEPRGPVVTVDALTKYYKAGYDAVRKYNPHTCVIMSTRLSAASETELLGFMSNLSNVVIDTHYYNLFQDFFNGMTVDQNINFIQTNRSEELNRLTTANGPLTFIGEWVAEWTVDNATMGDYQRFAEAELEVFGRASFGWAYWTFKHVNNHWSLKWMIENNYIHLK